MCIGAQCPKGKAAVNSPPQRRNTFLSVIPGAEEEAHKSPEAFLCVCV